MPPIKTDFYERIIGIADQNLLKSRVEPLWLGGSAGANGGEGSRPGGFIGQLIQRAIAYDITEAGTLLGSGSLVDNLNHIRYHINLLSGILISGFLGLTDTPNTYVGQAGKVLVVNDTATGIEFTDTIAAAGGNSVIEATTRWDVNTGVSGLELPDSAEQIYMLSRNGLIEDYLDFELSDDGFTILLSGVVAASGTKFMAHYLVRTY